MFSILILEDDDSIRELVSYTLNQSGYKAQGYDRPSLFFSALKKEKPDLVLLDIMLPEIDGLNVLQKLKNNSSFKHIPVIILTAKSTEYDTVIGLETGADDYITKPFGMMELLARIKAVLRRVKNISDKKIQIEELVIYPDKHEVYVDGKKIKLTSKEYELLVYLIQNLEIVVSRETLLEKVWGYDFDGSNRTVDVHIRSLRKKLGPCAGIIQTERGFGYKAIRELKEIDDV